ncbi:MAG: ABC transporter ATP-binding protein [Spirochaetales bacterium]|nr:ABC transporter ATP-binding protein [Spirochaetales bacterium]
MQAENYSDEHYQTRLNPKTIRRVFGLLGIRLHWAFAFIGLIAIVSVQDAVFTFLNKFLIDEGVVLHNMPRLFEIISWYGIVAVSQAFCVFGFIAFAGLLGEQVCLDLRKRMFCNLQGLSFSFFNNMHAGKIISRVTSDTSKITELITWGIVSLVWSILNITASIVFMMFLDWKLALIVISVFPVIIYLSILFRKKILTQFRKVRKSNSRLITFFNETITGHSVVKAFCREELNNREFGQVTGEMYNASYRAAWLSAVFLPVIQLAGTFTIGAIMWIGGWQYSISGISIGSIQAFIGYVTFILWPVRELSRVWASMQNALAAGERVFTLIDEVPGIRDRQGAYDPVTLQRHIHFKHVNFSYNEREPVLTDFNLEIEPGQTIALVGPTGSGKSTIINLICRFYEPVKGELLFDGTDYRQFTLKGLQSRFGIVLQTPHLFSGTIRENIAYGKINATDDDVVKAAKTVRAHEFIITFPDGYGTEVGEAGNFLSVGQKQLISLARAVISDPDIFIMDEATSSIDAYTEQLIQKGLAGIMENRTSIIIAHRLSTVRHADRILVLEKGRIIEDGSHDELIRLRGKYYTLYSRIPAGNLEDFKKAEL